MLLNIFVWEYCWQFHLHQKNLLESSTISGLPILETWLFDWVTLKIELCIDRETDLAIVINDFSDKKIRKKTTTAHLLID